MRSFILLALIAGFSGGCATSPQSQEEYAATINADRRVWPPYDPESAFPPQIMDGESSSRSDRRDGGRDGGARDGRDGGGRDGGGRDAGRGGGRR